MASASEWWVDSAPTIRALVASAGDLLSLTTLTTLTTLMALMDLMDLIDA